MILSIYAICGAISILCNFSCFTMNILFAEIPYVWIALAPGCVCTVWGLIWSSGVFSRWRTKPFAESLTQYGKHPVSLIKQDTGDSYALSHWQSAVSNTAMLVTLSHSRTGPCRGLANDRMCVCLWASDLLFPVTLFLILMKLFLGTMLSNTAVLNERPGKGNVVQNTLETQTNKSFQKICMS